MRLLILTQAVDLDDPALGFFHRWIEEIAARVEHADVVCLKAGRFALPANVTVHSLGKERGRSRMKYIINFYRYIFSLRSSYDSVFVHMNAEYVVLGGLFWCAWGKRVVLWRNHKRADFITWLAAHLAHVVCYTSPVAYAARFANAARMPIGIDMKTFATREGVRSGILFLGRLDAVKKPEIFLAAMRELQRVGIEVQADVYGDPTPGREEYAEALRHTFADLKNVAFHSGVRHGETPALYGTHAVYVNLTPSGSFDKTIGEAMASGAIVVCSNDVVRGVIPDALIVQETPEFTASGLRYALSMNEVERHAVAKSSRAYVEREHSLSLLAEKLVSLLSRA